MVYGELISHLGRNEKGEDVAHEDEISNSLGQTTHYFTFGQDHMTNFPLPLGGGRLADYWVEVIANEGHRSIFVERFTGLYCPTQSQFAFEYTEDDFRPEFYPNGCLKKLYG